MASTTSADGKGGLDIVGRLNQMGNRTNLMVIDATLGALPGDEQDYAEAAAEIRALSRRMMQAAKDFQATIEPVPAE
ncbi:hypothetical protein [Azospirillum sp. sgz301742]